jgi:UDP-N-acetyl-D-mannosaminuronic acid dehydrogenase
MDKALRKVILNTNLKITNNPSEFEQVTHCFITVGTPLLNGINDTTQIENVVNTLAPLMSKDSIFCLRSTVALGTSRKIKELLIEIGHNGYIAICPERTIEGNALNELNQLPQIIGAEDKITSDACLEIFNKLSVKTILTQNFEVAELAKLACNAWRDLYFAFANEIALIGEDQKINSIEALEVAQIDYPRFRAARPGPVGGPCLVKDGKTLANSSLRRSNIGSLFDTARAVNQEVVNWAIEEVEKISNHFSQTEIEIGILGLSFKSFPLTDDLRNSPTLDFISLATKKWPKLKINTWDSIVRYTKFREVINNSNITLSNTIIDLLANSNILVIWHKLSESDHFLLKQGLSISTNKVIIDLNANFNRSDLGEHEYFSFGSGY